MPGTTREPPIQSAPCIRRCVGDANLTPQHHRGHGLRDMAARLLLVAAAIMLFASHAAVARAQTPLQPLGSLKQAAEHYLRAQFTPPDGRIEIHMDAPDPRLRLAACAQPLRASLPLHRLAGTRVSVRVDCSGPQPWAVYLPADVHVYRPVLVALQALSRGQALGPGDAALQMRAVNELGYGFIDKRTRVTGLRLLRPVLAGTPLDPGMFAPRLLVHRGDRVSLLAVLGPVQVRSIGTALADGVRGARIPVRNDTSGKIVQGLVDSPGTVQVPD